MKRCPTCNKTFTDRNLSFCIDDGTPLVPADISVDDEAPTLILPSVGKSESHPVEEESSARGTVPPSSPPGAYVPPGNSRDLPQGQHKRRAWPWIVSILAMVLLVFAGLGIAGALLLPRMRTALSKRDNSNYNANVERRDSYKSNANGSNANSVANEDSDNSVAQDTTPPPTDEGGVLTDLTDLEHEWTVANINADKKKLNRILADDYVGTIEGKTQGKAEYLKTIERDTTIQKWDFEDLKVNLKGDRAALTGIIRLVVQDQNVAYRFTDKFVWRDNRWQATSSEVSPV